MAETEMKRKRHPRASSAKAPTVSFSSRKGTDKAATGAAETKRLVHLTLSTCRVRRHHFVRNPVHEATCCPKYQYMMLNLVVMRSGPLQCRWG